MKSLPLISLYICVWLAIFANSIKCDGYDSLLQYDSEIVMSNSDEANKEIYEDEVSVLPDSGLILEHEVINEQSDQPVSGERFIAVRINKLGAAENLKTNLVGVSNMAIQFLPKDYKLVEVIKATREIVSGVRYDLLIKARNENDDTYMTCRLLVTEKTWKITAWGDKERVLDFSNCTSNTTNENDLLKENNFNFNPLFVTKTNFINEEELKLIEAQIIQAKDTVSHPKHSKVSDANLGNVGVMIIPSKNLTTLLKLTSSDVNNNISMDSVKENLFNNITTTEVSRTETVINSNQLGKQTELIKSETLTETNVRDPSLIPNFTTEKTDKNHETPLEEVSSQKILIEKENVRDIYEIYKEQTFMQSNLNYIIKKSEKLSTNAPFVTKDTSHIISGVNTLPTEEVILQQSLSGDELSTKQYKSTIDLKENNKDISKHLEFVELPGDRFQPPIEGLTLQMAVSSTPKTTEVSRQTNGQEKEINEYAAELYEKDDSVIESSLNKRSKRDLNAKISLFKYIANEALEQLDYADADNFKRVVLDILRVKETVQENSVTYVIEVKTANSNCPEDRFHGLRNCLVDIVKSTIKLCFIEVKSRKHVNKVIKSECAGEPVELSRIRKGQPKGIGIPFGTDLTEADQIENLVKDALTQLNRKTNTHFTVSIQKWIKPEPIIKKFYCGDDNEVTRTKRSLLYDPSNSFEKDYEKNVNELFGRFKREFNRNYESAMEHDMRLRIFKHNLYVIDEWNRNEQGTATYGVTEFADYTLHEYKQRTGLLRRKEENNDISHPVAEIPHILLPKSFDWRDKGIVTEVKNQGNCGSCWAFSVIGNIEGLNAIKTGKLEEYSEQELIDCDTIDQGCNGGLPDNAYKAIEQLGGLELESEYPYSATKSNCNFNSSLSRVQISGAVDLPKNETVMAQYLVQNGPLSIGINANAMQFYRGGISHPLRILCRPSNIDHGVLIVGYGVADYPLFNKTLPYWIIKNSWGATWGEQGFYRVFRGENACGVAEMVTSAVLK